MHSVILTGFELLYPLAALAPPKATRFGMFGTFSYCCHATDFQPRRKLQAWAAPPRVSKPRRLTGSNCQPKIRPAVSNKEIPKARSKDSDKGVGKLDPEIYNQTCYGLLRVVCSPMSKRVKTSPHPTPRCSSTEM